MNFFKTALVCLAVAALVAVGGEAGAFGAPQAKDEIPKDRVVLIVNGDDVGMAPVFTDATIEAFLAGDITSLSIVAPAGDADRAIGLLRGRPGLDVGVHLTLTGDWRPLTAGPSLRNRYGRMWNTEKEAARNVKADEARVEWDAQVKKILDSGLEVSHLDSHMGCYFLNRDLFTAAAEVSRKYRIPLIAPFQPGQMPAEWRRLFPVTSYSGIYTLGGRPETLANRAAAYWKMFDELPPGVHYLFTHQGKPVPKNEWFGDLDLRVNETAFWTSEETAKKLEARGIVLIGCMPLKRSFEKLLPAPGAD